MKTYYKDFYGVTASIGLTTDGRFRLRVATPGGVCSVSKVYGTERGAKIAMGRCSDRWKVVKA